MSLLLVFGTMVEFSIVLMIKQKSDKIKKSIDENDKLFTEKIERFGENIKKVSKSKTYGNSTKQRTVPEMVDQHVTPNRITHILIFIKDMPSYRKIDVMAFFLFSSFFLCFNFVYFIVCIYI